MPLSAIILIVLVIALVVGFSRRAPGGRAYGLGNEALVALAVTSVVVLAMLLRGKF